MTPRSRVLYAGLAGLIVLCGLATRPLHSVIGPFWAGNLGDALWAALVYLLIAGAWRRLSSERVALAALTISFAVEFSQLSQAPWLVAIRRTTLGGLVLGWGFAWTDLAAYAAGAIGCLLCERWLRRNRREAGRS